MIRHSLRAEVQTHPIFRHTYLAEWNKSSFTIQCLCYGILTYCEYQILWLFFSSSVILTTSIRTALHSTNPTNLQEALASLLQDGERRPLERVRVGALLLLLLLLAVGRRGLGGRVRVGVAVLLHRRRALPLPAATTPLAARKMFWLKEIKFVHNLLLSESEVISFNTQEANHNLNSGC